MSNTSSVTPYESTSTTEVDIGAVGSAVATGVASLVGWLCEETAEDRAATERRREERRQERLARTRPEKSILTRRLDPISLTTIRLKAKTPDSLVRSAAGLGYSIEPLRGALAPLAETGAILLRHSDGSRLAITRDRSGHVQVETAAERSRGEHLVRQHTVDQATAELAKQGMDTQTVTLANGEAQILAREQGTDTADGSAVVRLQVHADGNLDVDVDCVRGRRCERIVGRIAEAIGGEVRAVTKKSTYYEEPGEPTLRRVKV